jgi:excisionase family DNA binding protein
VGDRPVPTPDPSVTAPLGCEHDQARALEPRVWLDVDAASRGSRHHLLIVEEVALLLRTTPKAIYAMVERRQLPGVRRIGRRVLFCRATLLDWLDHTCASSPKEHRR